MKTTGQNSDVVGGAHALVIPQPSVRELASLDLDDFEIKACENIYHYLLSCDGSGTLSRMQDWLMDWVAANYIRHYPDLRYTASAYITMRHQSLQKLLYLSEKLWFGYNVGTCNHGTVEAIWRYALRVKILYPDAVLVFLPGDMKQYIEIMSEHRTTRIGGL